MNILSVLLGLGAGVGIASAVESGIAWIIAPFAASIVYLLMESLETAAAEKILKRAGNSKAEETSP